MKEPVRRTNHPWIVAVIVAAIGGSYFYLLGTAKYPEPGPNLSYDVETWRKVDEVETRFMEVGSIVPDMADPRAMTMGPDGRLYVAGKNVIAVYGDDDEELSRIDITGTPKCLAMADDGTFYVGYPAHVEVVNPDGTVASIWKEMPRAYITSIDVQGDNIYVADAGNRVVFRYDRDGNVLGRIGEIDPENDIPGIEVPSPYLDLAVNPDGDLWVVNPGLLGMERYRSDGSIVTSWYRPTLQLEGFSGCCNPTHVAFTSDGKLITAEKGLVRLKMYDVTSGEFEELIAGSKLFPREQSLRDLVVDGRNRILVLDPRTNTIRIFDEKDGGNDEIS